MINFYIPFMSTNDGYKIICKYRHTRFYWSSWCITALKFNLGLIKIYFAITDEGQHNKLNTWIRISWY